MCLTVRHISLVSIHGQSEAVHRSGAEGVAVFDAAIPGIALHGVDQSILYLLYNSNMIGQAVALPIEKDDIAGAWFIVPALPLAALYKPVHIGTHGKRQTRPR